MKCRMRCYCSLLVFVFLCACAPVTMNQLLADGKAPLSEKQLYELVTENSLHLEAIDIDATVQYLPDGRLTAKSIQGEEDKGKWSITADDRLCMKFDSWYYGDVRCYKLINDKDQYIFFTTNGARYYTGTATLKHDDLVESKAGSNNSKNMVRGQDGTSSSSNYNATSTRLTKEEREHALMRLARNCPDCNFSGADFQGAQLVAANLAGADLSGADLRDANLRRANLAGANLSGAKLVRTNLAGANLTNCDLSDADLTGSNLIRANVTGAKFQGADLSGAHLESIQGFKE